MVGNSSPSPDSGRAWIAGVLIAAVPALAGFALAIFIAFRAFEDGNHQCRTWWGIFGMAAGVIGLICPFWFLINRNDVQRMKSAPRAILLASLFVLHFALLGFIIMALDSYANTARAIIPFPQTLEFGTSSNRTLQLKVKPVFSSPALSIIEDQEGQFHYLVLPRLHGAPSPVTLVGTIRVEANVRIFRGQLTLIEPYRIEANAENNLLRIGDERITKPRDLAPGTYAFELTLN